MKQYRSLLAALLMGSVFAMSSCLKKDFETPPDSSGYDPALPVNMKIRDLKAKFIGPSSTKIDSNWTIYGVVTADDRSGNFYKQINIEDSTGGITLLLDNNSLYNEYPVGRKVYVKLQGLYFGYYSKLPQLGAEPDATGSMSSLTPVAITQHIVKASYPNAVTPQTVTLAQIKATNTAYLNRLVRLDDVQIAAADSGKTYAQSPTLSSGTSITIEDCSGNKIVMRTSGYANFQSFRLPKGKGSIVALYTTFNTTPQLVIRDTSDLKFYDARCGGGGGGGGGTTLLSETFGSATSGDINLTGWVNFAEAGGKKWSYSNAGSTSNPYARASAFNSNQASVISWLITPRIDLAGATAPSFSFKSSDGFDNGATLKVYISTNFDGTNVTAATWTLLNPTLAPSSASGYSPFTASGNVSLAAYTGQKVYLAFKYEGADPAGTASDKTTTWEIDDLKVVAN